MRTFPALLALVACSDFNLKGTSDKAGHDPHDDGTDFDPETDDLGSCEPAEFPPEDVVLGDTCHYEIGGFEPVIAWEAGSASCSVPAVGDIDSDGMPDIVVVDGYFLDSKAELTAYRGDGTPLWETRGASLAYGTGATLADLDEDGQAEILVVRMYEDNLFGNGEFSVVKYNSEGKELAESDHYTGGEFDHATGIIVADMEHDGAVEIVAGRVFLNEDLSERGVAREGRGCDNYVGLGTLYGEGSTPAIADMDLDGTEEVVVGNAFYGPDGHETMKLAGGDDGATAIANLDADPEAEYVRSTYSNLVAHDTDGTELWDFELPEGTGETKGIMSVPSVADIDGDGKPEIIAARANNIWAVNGEDGSILWHQKVHDSTGASGASTFDFEGDGILEVVYFDEVAIYAFSGTDGTVKFTTDEHGSDTMYDYPVVADVDADGHADIVVSHDGFYGAAFSVYRDVNNSWAPARSVWNQFAYSITNINDDLTVPVNAVPNFTTYNNYRSANALPPGEALAADLEGEILAVCTDNCDRGWYTLTARARNSGATDVDPGLSLTLYAEKDGERTALATSVTKTATPSGRTSEAVTFSVESADIEDADSLWVIVDDNGSGTGNIAECEEENNEALQKTPFCK